MTSRKTYLIVLCGAVCWCAAILLPPLCAMLGGPFRFVGTVLYGLFRPICHQLDDRSFHLLGEPLAVCIRCSSIYFAFLIGILFIPLAGRLTHWMCSQRSILLCSVLPMLIDVFLDVSDVHASTTLTRAVTGSLFGLVVPFYIIPAALEGIEELLAVFRPFIPSGVKKGSFHA